ncbi:aldose 1-epimerase family protein [Butyrivibrio sp. MC2013]|uniref:aldose 1-epimerase family protein n=1 Tax=Butyrivibrio sp. MC2013 TaxID=1280686 RepID=UPI0004238F68|nr:aldose 1-epimerase family protein [Butyrivibrio sp. MC2013]
MGITILENDLLRLEIDSKGAELIRATNKETHTEYIWNGDAKYWKRHAPVLFPLVGNVIGKQYKYKDKIYSMGQHGFARDREFEVIDVSNDHVIFSYEPTEEDKEIYPFDFELNISYSLEENSILTYWNVYNTGDDTLYFSIGGHPAFNIPAGDDGDNTLGSGAYLYIDGVDSLEYKLLGADGTVENKTYTAELDEGYLRMTSDMFDRDAYIVEKSQTQSVALCDSNKKEIVTVNFHTPVYGLWSPAGLNAPFVCIEPWYGRTDGEGFSGNLEEREYGNSLAIGGEFAGGYEIVCH